MKVKHMSARQLLWRIVRPSPLSGSAVRSRSRRGGSGSGAVCSWSIRTLTLRQRGPCLSFGRVHNHLLATDDASPVAHRLHLLDRRIGVTFIHIARCGAVAYQVAQAADEGARCEENVADDIERETVVCEYETEEGQIRDELEEV